MMQGQAAKGEAREGEGAESFESKRAGGCGTEKEERFESCCLEGEGEETQTAGYDARENQATRGEAREGEGAESFESKRAAGCGTEKEERFESCCLEGEGEETQ